jgi:hypothetical protein
MCHGSSVVPDASNARIGPARATVSTVEPMSTPPESATSPPAMAVVAMEAISHGANPMVVTPSRKWPATTRWATSHDSAGNTVMPAIAATVSGCQAAGSRRRLRASMLRAVENTKSTKKMSIPWWRSSHSSGARMVRPMIAATATITSSRYSLITWRPGRGMDILSPRRVGEATGSPGEPAAVIPEQSPGGPGF